MGAVGLVFGAKLRRYWRSWLLLSLLIAIVGGFELYRRWRDRRSGEEGNASYYRVRPSHRLLVGLVYFGLIGALVAGMAWTFVDHSARI